MVRRTVRNMFSEQTVRPVKNGLNGLNDGSPSSELSVEPPTDKTFSFFLFFFSFFLFVSIRLSVKTYLFVTVPGKSSSRYAVVLSSEPGSAQATQVRPSAATLTSPTYSTSPCGVWHSLSAKSRKTRCRCMPPPCVTIRLGKETLLTFYIRCDCHCEETCSRKTRFPALFVCLFASIFLSKHGGLTSTETIRLIRDGGEGDYIPIATLSPPE